jgi:hypothetical protein
VAGPSTGHKRDRRTADLSATLDVAGPSFACPAAEPAVSMELTDEEPVFATHAEARVYRAKRQRRNADAVVLLQPLVPTQEDRSAACCPTALLNAAFQGFDTRSGARFAGSKALSLSPRDSSSSHVDVVHSLSSGSGSPEASTTKSAKPHLGGGGYPSGDGFSDRGKLPF